MLVLSEENFLLFRLIFSFATYSIELVTNYISYNAFVNLNHAQSREMGLLFSEYLTLDYKQKNYTKPYMNKIKFSNGFISNFANMDALHFLLAIFYYL